MNEDWLIFASYKTDDCSFSTSTTIINGSKITETTVSTTK